MEIIETDRNILKVRKTIVMIDKTGIRKALACMKTFVDVTTKPSNKIKAHTFVNTEPSKVKS